MTTEQVKLKPCNDLAARLTDAARFISTMWLQMPLHFRRQNQDANLAAGNALNDAIASINPPSPDAGERREAIQQILRTYFMPVKRIDYAADAILALSPAPDADTVMVPRLADGELVARVSHVATAVGKERHVRAASLTGHDWRRIEAAMLAASQVKPDPLSAQEGAG